MAKMSKMLEKLNIYNKNKNMQVLMFEEMSWNLTFCPNYNS